jgi:hypothetical protein
VLSSTSRSAVALPGHNFVVLGEQATGHIAGVQF